MILRYLRGYALVTILGVVASAVLSTPARAQQNDEATVKELERKLDEIQRLADALREEIARLRAGRSTAQPPSAPDDLTNIELVPAAEPAVAQPSPEPEMPAIEEVQPVESGTSASASKIFNPDISVIGTVVGHAGDSNPFEFGPEDGRGTFDLEEVEVALEAFIDPYAKGKFFLAIGEEGVEVEEGYAEFIALPWDLSAKVGKKKALFGKANTWHTHIRPWIDQPLVIHNFFGDEGLSDTGISVSKLLPNRVFFTELTGEVLSGNAEGVFERKNPNDLLYNAHLRLFRDLTENSNLELGTSYARGTGAESGGVSQFAAVDVSYRWKPLQRGLYRGFIGRLEMMLNDRDDLEKRLTGFYASAEWRLAQRWIAGARIDHAGRANSLSDEDVTGARFSDRGTSLLLTFQPSEFSQIRSQLRRTSYGGERSVTEFLLQLQFAIGAHGAHPF
jgi:hypothetical protein